MRDSAAPALASAVVNLRPLQLAAEIDIDGLPFCEGIQRRLPRLTHPIAGATCAAERKLYLRPVVPWLI